MGANAGQNIVTALLRHANAYGPLGSPRLAAFEDKLHYRLPADYRTFLLEHNGGIPDPTCFRTPRGDENVVACFFALHDLPWNDETEDGSFGFPLQAAWQDLEEMRPGSGTLPMGRSISGDYICIGYEPVNANQVFFFDHEEETIAPLAPTLADFLNSLFSCEREELP